MRHMFALLLCASLVAPVAQSCTTRRECVVIMDRGRPKAVHCWITDEAGHTIESQWTWEEWKSRFGDDILTPMP